MMEILTINVPAFVFLATGVFLLLHGHSVAGGWCVFVAICAAESKPKENS